MDGVNSRRCRRVLPLLLGLVLVVGVACGSRQPYGRLLAAQGGTPASDVPAATGTGDVATTPGEAATGQSGSIVSSSGSVTGPTTAGASIPGGASPSAVAAPSVGTGPGGSTPSCPKALSTINIGSVGEQSGVAGAAVADGPRAVSAWVQFINTTQGGVSCHPLKYTVADDGGDPSRNQALTAQLVEQNHVIAFVQNDAPLAAAGSQSYLVSHHIPVIGGDGSEQSYYQYPNFFPQASSGDALVLSTFAADAAFLNASQKAHLGLLSCIEAPGCSVFGKEAPKAASQDGMTLVYNGSASLAAPDFTSQCESAKQAGVTAFLIVMDPNSIHRIASSCAGVNFHPQILTGGQVVLPDMTSDPNLNSMFISLTAAPWTSTNIPAIAAFRKVIAQYGVGTGLDGSAVQGWTAGQLFLAGTMHLPANPTGQDILDGLDTVKGNDLGGLTGPLTFTKGQNAPEVVCWFQMQLRDGQFSSPNNGARQCK